ncbi:hypothetical protein CH298_21505 [Rhodococcoides fascians]|uniref:Iron reductase n=2 Tax=root TaxID=1 RepID=A0A143QQQ7_RHOFA|nr:hypothetical protein A3Q41_04069 [Rhodococcus fascians]KQU27809.1 hypothetical protein ASH04_23375 [Rhodococcus sp. Leaf233]MBJ7321608.1 hypothetical protein [Rhodococcus sp. (in: high G+C Gram-positive bacteria)]MDR6910921.1 hypothetical protein [Rhodococcus sp. 3258]MSX07269.1 hypothetical protein [Actinomycetota bacterium]OZD02722.1 hypothetical protein CH281_14090 [Rhodococcus sp. 06-221-2]OZD88737.1 hypothetical protein CH258_09400 [Rhodococcus sp. 05-2256-B4]OZD91817.1 hypothetical 
MSVATAAFTGWADVHRFSDRSGGHALLAESCSTLRALNPDYPRMYAVAAMADEGKRRWWQLSVGLDDGRVEQMYRRSLEDLEVPHAAAVQVATALIHAVVGRVAALLVLEARAWDPGIENLWIHMDSDGGIDWAGVASPILRVLPEDPAAGEPGTVTLPCEQALLVWTAHRCLTSLGSVYRAISERAPLDARVFWALVGDAILGASTYVPILAGTGPSAGTRRGQLLLDAMVAAGAPVRSRVGVPGRQRLRAS